MTKPPRKPDNPLVRYLRSAGITPSAFRARCAAAGYALAPQVLHRWIHGKAVPRPTARALLAQITGGAIPAAAWAAPPPPTIKTPSKPKTIRPRSGRVRKATDAGGAP